MTNIEKELEITNQALNDKILILETELAIIHSLAKDLTLYPEFNAGFGTEIANATKSYYDRLNNKVAG